MRILGLLLLLCAGIVQAQGACVAGAPGVAATATLTFNAPTTNTDGTPIATPLTYTLYQGVASGAETKLQSGLTGSPVTINSGLTDGTTFYWYIIVVDAKGSLSAPSNEVCKIFPVGTPSTVALTAS